MFKDKTGKQLTYRQALPKILNRVYNYFLDFNLLLLNYITWVPFHSFRKLAFKSAGITIGAQSTLHTGCRFYQPDGITIGEGTIIGDRCFLDGRAPLTIGHHVDLASQVLIYNSHHDINSPDFLAIEKPVQIKDYAFIGPRAVILPGVTVGKGAVVGAGAVVTKDIPDFAIVGGIPAKKIGERKNQDPHYRLGRPRLFQ